MVADSSVDRGDFLRGAVGAAAVVATVAAKPEKAAAIGIAGQSLQSRALTELVALD